jgi:hypothetical protein
MPSSKWMVVSCDPETGRVGSALGQAGTAQQVITWLRMETSFDPEKLAKYAVGSADALKQFQSAERWMEDHPAEHVVAAWTAGGLAARTTRQERLREWWPDLALALDNLEANDRG